MTYGACIVVPVYNHGAGVKALVQEVAPLGLQTILVNDASDIDCRRILEDLAKSFAWVHLVEHSKNLGKGGAVLTGLREALNRGFSHALQIDADGQHDVGDIPSFMSISQQHPKAMVTGKPLYDASVPKGRRFARYLTHFWVWIETLSFEIKDSMCGFRVYPLNAVVPLSRRVRLGQRMDFDPEVLVRLCWEGVPIISHPTRVIYPKGGQSHFRLWEDNWLITCMHVRLVFGMFVRAPGLLLRRARAGRSTGGSESSHLGTP
jgi:glycosyltransferase involved in cell wall biosynthesis